MPSDLRAELTRSAALALPVWAEARANSDFAVVPAAPASERDRAAAPLHRVLRVGDEPYDILLDDFERGMKTAEVRAGVRRAEGRAGAARRGDRRRSGEVDGARRRVPDRPAEAFELEVITRFGYDTSAWRIDETVHPFASGGGPTTSG